MGVAGHLENCIILASPDVFLLTKIRKCITFDAAARIYKTIIFKTLLKTALVRRL